MKHFVVTLFAVLFSLVSRAQIGFSPVIHSSFNQSYWGGGYTPFICNDFNNDGKLDFANSSFNDSSMVIYLGGGQGHFTFHQKIVNYETSIQGAYLACADFNHDGNLDIVSIVDPDLMGSQDSVKIYIGNGTGSFSLQKKFYLGWDAGAFPLVTMDVDNDNNVDIIGRGSQGDSLIVLFGNGTANFSHHTQYQLPSCSLATGPTELHKIDLNHDLFEDLICTNRIPFQRPSFSIIKNIRGTLSIDTTFYTPYTGIAPYTDMDANNYMQVIDMNNDKYDDILCAARTDTGTDVFVYTNDKTGHFSLTSVCNLSYIAPRIISADFSNDNIVDMGYNIGNDSIGIILGNGAGGFDQYKGTKIAINVEINPDNTNQAVDINGDGKADIITIGGDEQSTGDGINVLLSVDFDCYPKKGGVGGSVTVHTWGSLIHQGVKMKLTSPNKDPIVVDESMTFYDGGYKMSVVLDLRGKESGAYDITLTDTNGEVHVIPQGFTVEPLIEPNLWVNITGDPILRIGFSQVYTVTYGNEGNVDAKFVPILINGLPLGTNIEVLNKVLKIESISGFDTLGLHQDSIRLTRNDTPGNQSYRLLYIGKIAANSTGAMNIICHLPSTAALHSIAPIKITLGKPLMMLSESDLSNISLKKTAAEESYRELAGCISSLLLTAGGRALNKLPKTFGNAVSKCYLGGGTTALSALKVLSDYANNTDANLDLNSLVWGMSETAKSCAIVTGAAAFIAVGWEAALAAAEAEELFLLTREAQIAETLDGFSLGLGIGDVGINCSKHGVYNQLLALIGNSSDPNEKYGPGDSLNNYLNTDKPLSYTVNFQNLPSANLNAQTVTVTDSLNADYFDYSSFAFTSVVFADSIYTLNYPSNYFSHEFDFTAQFGVKARVTGTFDKTTGVAKWTFNSIDPITSLPTTDPLKGILPPDTVSPLGQGYVSFIVRPAANISTNTTICNKATIVFDSNLPITTKCWENTFDLALPVSKVDSLPATQSTETFMVSWKGTDNLSGIRQYDVYVSVNDSAYTLWKSEANSTTDTFSGVFGSKYSFYSIATDRAGNKETAKSTWEATTKLVEAGDGVKVYPNPSTGQFTLQVRPDMTVSNIRLFDLQGRRVPISYTSTGNRFQISTAGKQPLGLYTLKIVATDKTYNRKVMIGE